jgi:hypothetical protein
VTSQFPVATGAKEGGISHAGDTFGPTPATELIVSRTREGFMKRLIYELEHSRKCSLLMFVNFVSPLSLSHGMIGVFHRVSIVLMAIISLYTVREEAGFEHGRYAT